MAQPNDTMGMLDLMVRPGFCVKGQTVVKVNQSAAALMLVPGDSVCSLLHTGHDEYAAFSGGCLYLTLKISDHIWGASVTRMDDFDVFLLEEEADQAELQAMALAATELRAPLTSVMTTADRLFPVAAQGDDPGVQETVAQLNRGLFQMLRIISNMSDANHYSTCPAPTETLNIRAVLDEIFTGAAQLVSHAGLTLEFTNLPQNLFCLADKEKLERAVFNILSNAIKFTPEGGAIHARLTKKGNLLCLTVQDNGEGLADGLKSNVYHRFRRQPAIEDGRYGIGLGMVLIRSVAAQHGGTVLIDHPEESGTRITMTIAIRQNPGTAVRSPAFQIDYAGGRDHGLIELADCLPHSLYDMKKVN